RFRRNTRCSRGDRISMRPSLSSRRAVLLAAMLASGALSSAAESLTRVRLATDDDVFIPALAEALGNFRAEGIEIVPVKVDSFEKEDYLLQAPLNRGQLDA